MDVGPGERPANQRELRQRRAERAAPRPYWDGFILKYEGNWKRRQQTYPIAALGLGYEEAQTACECLLTLAGMPEDRPRHPRATIFAKDNFQSGLKWILTPHEAAASKRKAFWLHFMPPIWARPDPVEAAKWAHLYLTNPTRLNLGAPVLAQGAIDALEAASTGNWLAGKERPHMDTGFPSATKNLKPPQKES